jgi:hypothetical protein
MVYLRSLGGMILLITLASADFFTARDINQGDNIDLGHLDDVEFLYSLIGHNFSSNMSSWIDVTPLETLNLEELSDIQSAPPTDTGLVKRESYCDKQAGITRMVCDNVPSREWFWAAGGPLIIWYGPDIFDKWVQVR